MTRLNELAAKLTPAQLKEVEDFAEFLATRADDRDSPSTERVSNAEPPQYLDVDAIAGLCEGMGGSKTAVELIHELNDIRAAEIDD